MKNYFLRSSVPDHVVLPVVDPRRLLVDEDVLGAEVVGDLDVAAHLEIGEGGGIEKTA